MITSDKLNWLINDFITLASTLKADAKGKWGVMNAQQMIEHMSDSVRQGNGKDIRKLLTPAEYLEKARTFMLSDRQFRENTKNIGLPETPFPLVNASMEEAIAELKAELKVFVEFYKTNENATMMNPVFGELDYEQWVHLLHKHAQHHARQFGLLND